MQDDLNIQEVGTPNAPAKRMLMYWKKNYKMEKYLLAMVTFEKGWKDTTKVSLKELQDALDVKGNRALHTGIGK